MLTKQFYVSISLGELEVTAVLGTAMFEEYVKTLVLNPSLLSDSELELFTGTLAVMGLLEYCRFSSGFGFAYIKYGVIS